MRYLLACVEKDGKRGLGKGGIFPLGRERLAQQLGTQPAHVVRVFGVVSLHVQDTGVGRDDGRRTGRPRAQPLDQLPVGVGQYGLDWPEGVIEVQGDGPDAPIPEAALYILTPALFVRSVHAHLLPWGLQTGACATPLCGIPAPAASACWLYFWYCSSRRS